MGRVVRVWPVSARPAEKGREGRGRGGGGGALNQSSVRLGLKGCFVFYVNREMGVI